MPWQADGKSAEAHAGLAEVRERSGDTDAARKEAQTALELNRRIRRRRVCCGRFAAKAGKVEAAGSEVCGTGGLAEFGFAVSRPSGDWTARRRSRGELGFGT